MRFDGASYIFFPPCIGSIGEFEPTTLGVNTGGHQGVCVDDSGNFYVFHSTWIKKYDSNWNLLASNTNVNAETGTTHQGPGCYYDGKIYAGSENYVSCSSWSPAKICVWDADDLSFIEAHDISEDGHNIGALTVYDGVIYVVSYCTGATVWKYDLSTYDLLGTITLSPVCNNPQGIAIKADKMYIADTKSVDSVVGLIHRYSMAGARESTVWGFGHNGAEAIDYNSSVLYNLVDASTINSWGVPFGSYLFALTPRADITSTVRIVIKPFRQWGASGGNSRIVLDRNDYYDLYYLGSSKSLTWKLTTAQGNDPRPTVPVSLLPANREYRLDLVYRGTTAEFYVDGVLRNSVNRDNTPLRGDWMWQISDALVTQSCMVEVNKFQVFSRALTVDELWSGISPSDAMILDCDMIPRSGIVPDKSGHHNHGYLRYCCSGETKTERRCRRK